MKNRLQLLLSIILLGTLSGCKPLVKLVNQYFPPLTTSDQQITSISQNLNSMNTIQPQIGAFVGRELLDKYLPNEIKNAAEEYSDDAIKIISFDPKLDFKDQAIFATAKFELELKEYKAIVTGNLFGLSSVATQNDSLYVRNAFQTLKISKIEFSEKPSLKNKALSKLIKPIVANFLDNLNGLLLKKPTVVYLGWEEALKVDPKELFRSSSTEVVSQISIIDRKLKNSSILIDKEGIWVLIEIGKSESTKQNFTSNETLRESEVRALYKSFKEKFEEKWSSNFDKIESGQNMVVNIQKAELASILNESLDQIIKIKSQIKSDRETFSSKVEVEKSKIDCQKVRKPFHYDRYQRASCNWSCRVNTPLGSFDDPVCLSTRAACNVKEEARVAADNLKYETEKAAHNVRQEVEIAACNVWREANNFAALGKFSGYTEGGGDVNLEFNKFYFHDDLSVIDLAYSGKVQYKLKSKIDIQPMDLGYVFLCQFEYSKSTNSTINIDIPNQLSKISVTVNSDGDNLMLKAHLSPIRYNATINPSPLHEMYKDPKFLGGCGFFASIIGPSIAAGSLTGLLDLKPEVELILFGKANGEYEMDEMQLRIEPIPFKVNGAESKSIVKWKNGTIQFTAI